MNIYEIISATLKNKYSDLDVYYCDDSTIICEAVDWVYEKGDSGPTPFMVSYHEKYIEIARCDDIMDFGWLNQEAIDKIYRSVLPYAEPIIVYYADPMLMEIIDRELFEHFRLTAKIKKLIGDTQCS